MSNLRRGVAATAAAIVAVSLLAGCGADDEDLSFGPVENINYDPANGVSLDSTVIKVRDLYVIANEGAAPAYLRMSLVNTTETDDALVGATIGQPPVTGRLTGGTAGVLPVKAGTSVLLGASAAGPQVTFPGYRAKASSWVPVTLLFSKGRAVAGQALVQNAVSEYSDGTVPAGRSVNLPTPTATPEAHGAEAGGH